MVNKVTLLGNAGKDAELTYLASGTPKATFSLATTKKYKGKSGEMEEKTSWHNIVCWGKLAEIAAEFVCKGKLLYLEGEISYSQYEKNSEKHYKTEIVADVMKLLSGGPKRD